MNVANFYFNTLKKNFGGFEIMADWLSFMYRLEKRGC